MIYNFCEKSALKSTPRCFIFQDVELAVTIMTSKYYIISIANVLH